MKGFARFIFATVSLAAVCIGCESADKGTTDAPPKAESAKKESGAKLKVVYIPKNTGNAYFKPVIDGFKEAAEKLGCDFTTVAPATAEATSQISFIKEQIQQKVDIIAISPNSPDALNGALDEAKAKGIVVVTVDSDLEKNETHRDAAVVPTDFSKIGESQVELLGSQIGFAGPIAILSATHDAPNQNVWIEGMKAALKNPKYAKMNLVDIVYGDDDAQKSSTECEALLSKHADLKGIISPTSVGLAAAAKSLENAGVFPGGPHAKNGGLYLTGLSTPNQMKSFITAGVVKSFQLWSPKDMGVLACELGVGIKKGTIKPAPSTEFTLSSGKYQFGKNNVINAGPLVTFDKANISKYDF